MGPAEETNQEYELVQEDERKIENGDCDMPNKSFLRELNLIILVLSMLSLSTEDNLNFKEGEKTISVEDHEAEAYKSRLQSRRREINECNIQGRRTPRFQTTIKDFRYNFLGSFTRFMQQKIQI
ncbi:hypothetical protein L1049_012729 [Liquidambar formosana]|uniref:Uncharacterized protein n=1 Tax=Liquidambar formosana TaxID=63359 RepID=A0AAP0WTG8_LIQFO